MPETKTHGLDIQIGGSIAPSLKAATGLTEKEIKRLGEASRIMNSIVRKQTTQTFDLMKRDSDAAGEHVKHEFEKMRESGEKAAEGIHKRFEKLWDRFKEFSGISALFGALGTGAAAFGVAELGKEGVAIYNARQKLIERQNAIVGAQRARELREQIERTEGRTGFGFEQQMAAATKISGARPGQTAEQVATTLQHLQDLAGVPEKLDQTVSAFTNVFVRGQLSPRALKGFFDATGINLRTELARTFHVSPDEMTKLMGKKGLAPSVLIAGLEKTIARLTAVGGAFHGRAETFLKTFEGIQLRFKYLWENFASGFGHVVENLITPIANNLLDIFSNERMGEMFKNLQDWATRMGYAVSFLIGEIQKSGIEVQFQKIGQAISQLFGGFNLNTFFKDVFVGSDIKRVLTATGEFWTTGLAKAMDTVAEISKKLGDVSRFILDHFEQVKQIMIGIVALLVAERVAIMATNIGKLFGIGGVATGGAGASGALGAAAVPGLLLAQQTATDYSNPERKAVLQAEFKKEQQAARMGDTQEKLNRALLQGQDAALAVSSTQNNLATATDLLTENFSKLNNTIAGGGGNGGGGGGGGGGGAFCGTPIPYRKGSGGFPTETTPTAQGYRILEEYSYEGRSSQIGPRGNVIKTGEIGLGHELEKQYNIKQGDWVQTSGHGWRKVTESSNSAYGIEYHADKPGQFAGGSEREKILSVRHANDVMASHAFGGIFNVPHMASIAERGLFQAVIPLQPNARSLGVLEAATG